MVGVRTGYLWIRNVSPPRLVNVLHETDQMAIIGILAAFASLAVAAGVHRATVLLSRGRRP